MKWIIGVDEAGRGALAGPVCVGAVLYPPDFDWQSVYALVTSRGEPKLRDSKQLSEIQRERLYERITTDGTLRYAAGFGSAETIDTLGIVPATNGAAADAIRALGVTVSKASVQLDAGLRAPTEWEQEAFVRGDATYPAIAFASIIAKVSRDRLMVQLVDEGRYGFAIHKGYGTLSHRQGIAQHGLSANHRRSFCKSLTSK